MTGLRLEQIKYQRDSFSLTINLTLDAGKILILQGPNGAGKSTLLHLIAGLLMPASGKILWNDQEITFLNPAKRPFSLILQHQNLFGHLTVLQNLALVFGHRWWLSTAQKNQIQNLLETFDFKDFQSIKVQDLSGGQQQLVALLRSFLQQRPLFLWDEPFTGLDQDIKRRMLDFLRFYRSNTKTTMILTSHHRVEIEELQKIFPQKISFYSIKSNNKDKV